MGKGVEMEEKAVMIDKTVPSVESTKQVTVSEDYSDYVKKNRIEKIHLAILASGKFPYGKDEDSNCISTLKDAMFIYESEIAFFKNLD